MTENSSIPIDQNPSFARKCLSTLGPGLITGASDDDPSGIATYSQCGAQFGTSMLWLMFYTFPLMTAVQLICGRLGRITGRGIAGNLRQYYARGWLFPVLFLTLVANVINIGADIKVMAEAAGMLTSIPIWLACVAFALLSAGLQTFIPYTSYVKYLKWLTLSLLTYVATVLFVHLQWREIILGSVLPRMSGEGSLKMAVAILGTTISPYLFFWQASQEAEEVECDEEAKPILKAPHTAEREFKRIGLDTALGMGVSNLIAIFIIITTAAALHSKGITQIESAQQAAEALRPIAGNFCFTLFSIGIISTGLLAIPVLSGSIAYGLGEAFQWKAALEKKPREAKAFYGVLVATTLAGLILSLTHINAIHALVWSAVINGVVAVPVLALLMLLAVNPKVVGKFVISSRLRAMGWLTTVIMGLAALAMAWTELRP